MLRYQKWLIILWLIILWLIILWLKQDNTQSVVEFRLANAGDSVKEISVILWTAYLHIIVDNTTIYGEYSICVVMLCELGAIKR